MRISIHRRLAVVASVSALLVAPAAFAAGAYHPTNNEAGATFHPEHVAAQSRDQVNADLAAAQRQPAWKTVSRGAPWPVAKTGAGLTRDQVNSDLKATMKDPVWDSVYRDGGAPRPAPQRAATVSSAP